MLHNSVRTLSQNFNTVCFNTNATKNVNKNCILFKKCQTLISGEAGCHSGGPCSVKRPIDNGEAVITPTPLLLK